MVQALRRIFASIPLLLTAAVLLLGATGSINWLQINGASRHGNGTKGQASDGTGTSGNYAKFDANGNVTDGGAGSSITLQTGGTNNGSQTLLNLAGAGDTTVTDSGSGTVTIKGSPPHEIGMSFCYTGCTANALPTGIAYADVHFSCTIGSNWTAKSDGTVSIDVTLGGSSITGGTPATAANNTNTGSTSSWTKTVSGTSASPVEFGFNLSTATSATYATVSFPCQ